MGRRLFGLIWERGKPREAVIDQIPQPPGPDKAATRYRSFVERYVLERVQFWPKNSNVREMAHLTILDATSIYNMIRRADEAYGGKDEA